MTIMATENAATVEYSVSPCATVDIDPNDERIDRLLDLLIADNRALGASGVSYQQGRLSTTFQVEIHPDVGQPLAHATERARLVFDLALNRAGIQGHTDAVAAVEGDDPDLLP